MPKQGREKIEPLLSTRETRHLKAPECCSVRAELMCFKLCTYVSQSTKLLEFESFFTCWAWRRFDWTREDFFFLHLVRSHCKSHMRRGCGKNSLRIGVFRCQIKRDGLRIRKQDWNFYINVRKAHWDLTFPFFLLFFLSISLTWQNHFLIASARS